MIMNQIQHHQADDGKQDVTGALSKDETQETEEVFPGVPIVRSNTPRPLSFITMMSSSGQLQAAKQGEAMPGFPSQAPSAPPLPEELSTHEQEPSVNTKGSVPLAAPPSPTEELQEFIWLFEYGLEMDLAILNSSERLNGLAMLYGPAVLKGYTIMVGAQHIHGSSGPTIVAVVPVSETAAEVWGVLYRIPRRLTEKTGEDSSLLDTIHAAIAPQNFFKSAQVIVYEPYRNREVACMTYVATDMAYRQLQLVPLEQWHGDHPFVQRLANIARQQKLPDSYIQRYEASSDLREHQLAPPPRATMPSDAGEPVMTMLDSGSGESTVEVQRSELNTEPLPAVNDSLRPGGLAKTPLGQTARSTEHWLAVFAVYLMVLLLIVLIFAVMQGLGFGSSMLTPNFTPLGVPWLVMVYGLLGGCISCIVTLGYFRFHHLPLFILITWFTRPFVGAVLAVLAYLLCTSGFFIPDYSAGRHASFFLLISALAGFCEGWIFARRRNRAL